jgi:mannose-6-phosphate isomerase-like protein (cupin superfamily)
MIIDDKECKVIQGDAIYIPSSAVHGIKNIGIKIHGYALDSCARYM